MDAQQTMEFDHELLLQELRARASETARGLPEDETGSVAAEPEPPCDCADESASVPEVIEGLPRVPGLVDVPTHELADAVRDAQKVVYGVDDRLDLFEVTDAQLRRDADSVVALVRPARITDNGDGTSTLTGPTLGANQQLCDGEPFRDQPAIAFCSGFLVDPSLVLTAAHCVDNGNLGDVRFVFGFRDA